MKWEVTGADRASGKDRKILIDAGDENQARRRGNRAGLMVEDVRCIDENDSMAGEIVQHAQPVQVHRQEPPMVQQPQPQIIYQPVYMPHPQQVHQPQQQPVIQNNVIVTNNVGGGQTRRWSAGVAMILSLIIPGLGQIYKGQLINGVVWFVITAIGYAALIAPGIVLHICCVLGAGTGDPYKR